MFCRRFYLKPTALTNKPVTLTNIYSVANCEKSPDGFVRMFRDVNTRLALILVLEIRTQNLL